MNIWGTLYTLVLIFVIHFFLKKVYTIINRDWREGMINGLSSAQ